MSDYSSGQMKDYCREWDEDGIGEEWREQVERDEVEERRGELIYCN